MVIMVVVVVVVFAVGVGIGVGGCWLLVVGGWRLAVVCAGCCYFSAVSVEGRPRNTQ